MKAFSIIVLSLVLSACAGSGSSSSVSGPSPIGTWKEVGTNNMVIVKADGTAEIFQAGTCWSSYSSWTQEALGDVTKVNLSGNTVKQGTACGDTYVLFAKSNASSCRVINTTRAFCL